jgi:hypothetical protein
MAQVEFTQIFTVTGLATGLNTFLTNANLFITLPNGSGSYIIKGLNVYSSTGIAAGAPYSVQAFSTINSTTPGNAIYTDITGSGTPDAIDTLYSPVQGVILSVPGIGFNVNMTSAGNFYIAISYLFIPSTNPLAANFYNYTGSIFDTTSDLVTGSFANQATIISAVSICNAGATNASIVATLYINGVAITNETTINYCESYNYPIPLYLNSSQTLSLRSQSAGGGAALVVVSLMEDPV